MPAGGQVFVTEDHVNNSSTVDWWVGVHWSGELLQSGVYDVGFFSVGANEMDVTGSLTIETEVLGERLEKAKSVGVVSKVSDGVSILVKVSTGETLVSTIKSSEMAFGLHNFQNLLPLVSGWILSSWVVSTRMQNDNLFIFSVSKILEHAINIKTSRFSIVISIVLPSETSLLSNTSMCWPCWVWNVNFGFFIWEPGSQEIHSNSKGTSSRNSLARGNSV